MRVFDIFCRLNYFCVGCSEALKIFEDGLIDRQGKVEKQKQKLSG